MDRWKFVNEKWIPRPVSRGEGFVSGIPLSPSNLLPFGAPPSIGRRERPSKPLPLEGAAERSEAGVASFFAADRVLSFIACLRRSSPLFFIPLVPYPARFARRLPHAGKALSIGILFLHVSCIRFDDARKPAFSFSCLSHRGRGTALAVDRVLS